MVRITHVDSLSSPSSSDRASLESFGHLTSHFQSRPIAPNPEIGIEIKESCVRERDRYIDRERERDKRRLCCGKFKKDPEVVSSKKCCVN